MHASAVRTRGEVRERCLHLWPVQRGTDRLSFREQSSCVREHGARHALLRRLRDRLRTRSNLRGWLMPLLYSGDALHCLPVCRGLRPHAGIAIAVLSWCWRKHATHLRAWRRLSAV